MYSLNYYISMFRSISILFLTLCLLVSVDSLSAWVAPTALPPASNVAAPLNTSAVHQIKAGGLALGSLQVEGGAEINGTTVLGDVDFTVTGTVGAKLYCNENGTQCFSPNNTSGLPTCTSGQTLVADAAGAWVCGAPSVTVPVTKWLVNNQHSEAQCTSLNGTVYTSGTDKFCQFAQSACPTGWARYQNWTTTQSRSCTSGGGALCTISSCSVTGHGFGNIAPEACAYILKTPYGMGEGPNGNKGCTNAAASCAAPITQVGCY